MSHNEEERKPILFHNKFMFGTVLRDPELCKGFLECILQIKIQRIEYVESEVSVDAFCDSKGIRMDVYVEGDAQTIYNIEMQTTNNRYLPKRSRYYQVMTDTRTLEKGRPYSDLKRSYVIFICLFDPFPWVLNGKKMKCNLPVYTFKNTCIEDSRVELADETTRIFINTKGDMEGEPEPFQRLMHYINTGEATDDFTRALEERVEFYRKDKDWRDQYMMMALWEMDARQEGIDIGLEQGIAVLIEVCQGFQQTREETQEQLMKKFHLTLETAEIYIEKYWKD